ncbi:MAG: response regulator transcription factor [Pedobacter sp.]|nr:MAG: response regulator transcription factor [Pedobacter sp.]
MNQRIYILEDDPDIGLVLQYFLTEEGFDVQLFASVDECQHALDIKLPDLCLFDIMLPDGDGITICNTLKKEHQAEVPVILMSAGEKESNVYEKSQADVFIPKPFDLEVLLNNINRLIHPAA